MGIPWSRGLRASCMFLLRMAQPRQGYGREILIVDVTDRSTRCTETRFHGGGAFRRPSIAQGFILMLNRAVFSYDAAYRPLQMSLA